MKSPYITELVPSQQITTAFLVHSKEIRDKKTGEPYLSLVLGDRTGKIDAKMWDNVAEILEEFDRDDFVKVKGVVQLHLNRPQVTVHKVRRLDDSEVDFADFFPASARNPDEMWSELVSIVSGVANPHLRALLEAFVNDPEIAQRYRKAPAAKTIHHAYLGGLLEHVLSLCCLCRLVGPHYPFVDSDLLIAGAVLHDIGKIYELNYDRGFNYSSEGQLLGHILIGIRMLGEKLHGLPDFPPRLRSLIEHIILSHHGKLEFGSPKLPQFPEALLFHYLDDLDSKMECMRGAIDGDRAESAEFTNYQPALERVVLKKNSYLNPAPTGAVSHPATAKSESATEPAAPLSPGDQMAKPSQPPNIAASATRQQPVFRPATSSPAPASIFGSKLLDALKPAAEKPEAVKKD